MKEVIDSLKPETDAGKRLLGRAKSAIRFYQGRLELARVTLEELVTKLEQNPDDTKSISM